MVVKAHDVTKAYRRGARAALSEVSFQARPGQVTGLLGPNGAGKTTLMSLLAGLSNADSGSISLEGHNGRPVTASDIGAVLDQYGMFGKLSARAYIEHVAALYGVSGAVARARTADLLTVLEANDSASSPVEALSTGSRKKIALASALVHGPSVILLDEPTETVDPVAQATIEALLRQFADANGTVLMSTHNLDLVERVCDRVVIISDGRIVLDDDVAKLTAHATLSQIFTKAAGISPQSVERLTWLW